MGLSILCNNCQMHYLQPTELMPKDGRDDNDESIYDYIDAVFQFSTERCINWIIESNYVLLPTQIHQWKQRSIGPETGVKLFVYWAAKLHQTTGYYPFFLQYRQEVLQIDLELMPKDGRDDDDEPFMTTSMQCFKYIHDNLKPETLRSIKRSLPVPLF